MWVRVIEQRSPTEWYGVLSNEPVVIESLEFGARVRFHPLDIIDVVYNRGGEPETCG
jgi:uncharacterized protein YegJ (DUF2314 family)